MDPDEALRLIRLAAEHASRAEAVEDEDAEIASLRELRNSFEDLDEWLSKGSGFLPEDWQRSG